MLVLHDWNIKKRQWLAGEIAYTSSKIKFYFKTSKGTSQSENNKNKRKSKKTESDGILNGLS